ncbi:MAG: hypothetical protein R3186_09920 [Ruegeria sp.]|nr:hypothetical protein [Ruegeria sp.]
MRFLSYDQDVAAKNDIRIGYESSSTSTAGIGVIGVAKTMINEIFSDLAIVTAAFAGTYVLMISVCNMVGRFYWASTSDYIGRKKTYHCFFVPGTILYCTIPFWAASGGVTELIGFYIATMIIFTMYGGGFATTRAYLADIRRTMRVGGIHRCLLTAWSAARWCPGALFPSISR